jgi:PcaR/PcaU/PobR family beta-ketoadipate pathway transcriptional regulator
LHRDIQAPYFLGDWRKSAGLAYHCILERLRTPVPEHALSTEPEDLAESRRSSLFVGSLEKGLMILRAFDRERREMGLFEIVEASGLDKSSAQRFTFTLHALGYLRKDPSTKKYSLSPKVLELGFSYLYANSMLESAMPLLYEANRHCGESLNITELLGTEVVYIARVPGHHVISVDIFLGMRVPAYACAPGRAILAFLTEATTRSVLDRTEFRKLTPKTIHSKPALLAELQQVRRQGYALASEQCYVGELSAAAPILDARGTPVAALNVSVPTSRWAEAEVVEKLVPLVVETAAAISRGVIVGGHRWSDPRFLSEGAPLATHPVQTRTGRSKPT